MAIVSLIACVCLAIGLAFNALGVIGILRFPDVYTRLHADTKATTFGSRRPQGEISVTILCASPSAPMRRHTGPAGTRPSASRPTLTICS